MPVDQAEIDSLRHVVHRNLTDAAIPELSSDVRAGLSYDAARSAAMLAIRASGYRVRGLGSHEPTFEALSVLGSPLNDVIDYFQQLRLKRHALTYQTAGEVTDTEATEALRQARSFAATVDAWLVAHHPDLAGGA